MFYNSNRLIRRYAAAENDEYVIKDICNPFETLDNDKYHSQFGIDKTTHKLCSPGCMDFYYEELQFFTGVTSRSRETLFFSNYTHLINTVYPLPISIEWTDSPSLGLWGDRHHKPSQDIKPHRQATNFTDCPAIWHLFKVEASIYPIDDNFNMCRNEGFYAQSVDDSIDCAFTQTIGYGFMAVGAGAIVMMYGATFMMIYFKRMTDPLAFMPEIENDGEKQKKKKKKNDKTDKLKKFGLDHGFNEIPLKPVFAPWLTLMKDYVLFLITPIVEAADIVLDGLYVIKMARALNRFWISASIIRLMLKFYIVAVVKDVILNFFLITTFFTESMTPSPQKQLELAMIIKLIGFFTEDTAQSALQYFYFEKYQLFNDAAIIMKFIIGILVFLKSLKTLVGAASEVGWKKIQKRDIMYVLVYVMLTVVPFLRMVGLLVQASRGGSLVRAGCLEYRVSFNSGPSIRSLESNELDYQNHFQWDDFYMMARDEGKYFNENNATMKRFNVTPFNSQCLIAIDYLYLIGEFTITQ